MPAYESPFHTLPDFDALIAKLELIRPFIEAEHDRLARTRGCKRVCVNGILTTLLFAA